MANALATRIDLGTTTVVSESFNDTERLIEDHAKNQIAMNPTSNIFDVKRLIGRRCDDSSFKAT